MLELFVYRGQYQLATPDAIYSDGIYYKPLKMAFKELKADTARIKKVLVLGGGLGSAMQIASKYGVDATYVVVEQDNEIINMAKSLLPEVVNSNTTYICADAEAYMQQEQDRYDLIIVDVFNGRVPAEFTTKENFLLLCRKAMRTNGCMALNYIINGYPLWDDALEQIQTVFPDTKVLSYDINRVVISRV